MTRGTVGVLIGVAALVMAGILLRLGRPEPSPANPISQAAEPPAPPDSPASAADPAWIPWFEGDFKEKRAESRDGRIHLRCSTLGTIDKTVKALGMRSASPVRLGRETRVTSTLDWNRQVNGSYLTAALVLAPSTSAGNPLSGPNWLKIEYVGVPPGKNGRLVVGCRTGGRDRVLFQEGWPEENRHGRPLALQKIEVVLKADSFEVLENGRAVFSCPERLLRLTSAHAHVMMTSHSNYPTREVSFSDVRWTVTE